MSQLHHEQPVCHSSLLMRGTPCFAETRVPVKSLFDCLEAGASLDEFLDQFATVKKDAARQHAGRQSSCADRRLNSMRVLLDESVPCALGFATTEHFVRTAQAAGFSGPLFTPIYLHWRNEKI